MADWYDDPNLCPDWLLAEKYRLEDEEEEETDWDLIGKDRREREED